MASQDTGGPCQLGKPRSAVDHREDACRRRAANGGRWPTSRTQADAGEWEPDPDEDMSFDDLGDDAGSPADT